MSQRHGAAVRRLHEKPTAGDMRCSDQRKRGRSGPKTAPRPHIPAVAAVNTVGMLIQELISSTHESRPALAPRPSRDCCPNKQGSTRRGETINQPLIASGGSKGLEKPSEKQAHADPRRTAAEALRCPSHWLQSKTCIWSQARAASVKLKRLCSRPCYHTIPPYLLSAQGLH